MARNNVLHIRLNNSELERLQYVADQQEITVSEVIRDLIKVHLPHPPHARQTQQIPLQ